MIKFELTRLSSYTDREILDEIQRVAQLIGSNKLTRKDFDTHARADSSTVVHRFGSWQDALEKAGLGQRYAGPSVTSKSRDQRGKYMADSELVAELQRVARKIGANVVTMQQFNNNSEIHSGTLERRFGTWKNALERAGLQLHPRGQRYSEEEYFENLLAVWTHYGRQPKYAEMDQPPSVITARAYEQKWGKWRNALIAFVKRASRDSSPTFGGEVPSMLVTPKPLPSKAKSKSDVERRKIPLGLRYEVLKRDHFRCVLCGRSPATDIGCILHVDHIVPSSKGGKTAYSNLRSMCSDCNLGKSDRLG